MRRKLLCSLALLTLGTTVAHAQSFPNFKDPPPAVQPAPYAPPGWYQAPAPGYPRPATHFYPPPPVPYQPHMAPGYPPGYLTSHGSAPGQPTFYPSAPALPERIDEPGAAPHHPPAHPPMMPGFAVEDFQPMTFPEEPAPRRPHPDEYDGPGRWWISGDYLVAWLRSGRVAPLVTSGPVADPNAGVLGSPGTVTLFGGDLDFGAYHGFKAELGVWLDEERRYSLDLGGFYLPGDDINFTAASDAAGNPVLVRPIINADTGEEAGFLVARPGFAAGSTSVFAETEFFGVETNLRRHLDCSRQLQAEGLFGFRFLRLDEGVTVVDRLTPLNGLTLAGVPVDPGAVLTDVDSFQASNRFYGLQLGGQLRWDLGRLNVGDRWETGRVNLNLFAKLALGINDQSVNIGGLTTAGGQAFPAGILALASNSGDFSRGVFSMVPEFGINVSLEVVKNFHVRTGYSFLLWTDVVRPGEQIDRTVNPALVPSDVTFGAATGAARPAFSFQDELFWAHQFHVGIEFRR